MAKRPSGAQDRPQSRRRSRKLKDDPAREQAQAEVIADIEKLAIATYGSPSAWWDATGVPPATGSTFINNKGRPTAATLGALLPPLLSLPGEDREEDQQPEELEDGDKARNEAKRKKNERDTKYAKLFEQLVQGKLAAQTKFRPILLPTCIAPFSIDAVTLRFGSHEANLSEEDLTGTPASTPTFVHGLFLQRTPGSLPSNLDRQSHRGVRHPTQHTPLTYLRYQRALAEQESVRTRDPHASLLVLDKWGMELGPRLFGIIRPTRDLHPTGQSQFESSILGGQPVEQAIIDLRTALMSGSRILYETTHAHNCIEHLLKRLGLHYRSCKLTKIGSIGAAYELAEQHILEGCLLAVGHELLWSLAGKDESTLELLVADEGPNEKELLPDEPPFRVLAVRNDALSSTELKLTANWFQRMSANLRDVWEKRFPQLCEFVKPEIEKYGSLGGHYSDTHLRLLVAHGMHLHHPPLNQEPRFVPLDEYRPPRRELPGKPTTPAKRTLNEDAASPQPPTSGLGGGTRSDNTDDRSRAAPNDPE